MHVSWDGSSTKQTGTALGAKTDAYVMEAAAPAAAASQQKESSAAGLRNSGLFAKSGSKNSSVGVLQQHFQNATTKSITSATEALSLIQPALGLQPNFTANPSMPDSSSSSPHAETENLSGSSQVHMGFNDTIIHDSAESNDFSSVNSTDVIPISEMPDGQHDSSASSADWAQTLETDASDLADSPAQSMEPSYSVSASSAPSTTSASRKGDDSANLQETIIVSAQTILAIQNDDDEISAEPQPVSNQHMSLSPIPSVSEAGRAEDESPQMADADDSDWIHVDPYSDDLQGMIHPTSRMFRAPGK